MSPAGFIRSLNRRTDALERRLYSFRANKFIENLSRDLQTEYPDAKGFSVRNLKYMAKFASTYPDDEFVQTVSAQISWSHNIAIIDKVKDQQKRIW